METQTKQQKSFWTKPEGITGILLIGAGIFGLYKLLPFLISLLENTLYLGLLCATVAFIVWFISANKEAIWYLFKTFSLAFTKLTIGWAIAIDSMSIAKIYIASLKKKKDNIDEQVTKLGGAIEKIDYDINENNKGIKTNLKEAEEAKKRGDKGETRFQMEALRLAKEANYLKQSNDEIVPLSSSMKVMLDMLKKAFEVSAFIIKDKETEISILEKKYKAINIGISALRSAKSIIGYDEKKAFYEQSMEFIKDDMANKLSEMDRIIELVNPYIDRMELKESVNTEEANKLLAQFSANEFEKIISNLQSKPAVSAPEFLESKTSGAKTENAYSNILNS